MVRRIKGLWRVCLSFSLFCLRFSSSLTIFCPFACPFLSLLLLSSGCPLSLWLVVGFLSFGLLFLFPFRTIRKKKGHKVFSLRPLFVGCGCLDSCIVIKEFRCRCFGLFQFVGFVLPCDAASVRRFARFYFDFLRHYVDITYNRSAFLK